jgi:hypothetical protein
MTAEDLFGVIVRLAGLTFITIGLNELIHAIATLAGLPLAATRYSASADFLGAAFYGVLGLIILVAADQITRFAYRKR